MKARDNTIGRRRKPSVEAAPDDGFPFFSILVPTYRRPYRLQRCLHALAELPVYNDARRIGDTLSCLLDQTLQPREIIVIDDGSIDSTAEVVHGFGKGVVYAFKANGGPASARNLGVHLATGQLVAFTDSDCRPQRDWLARIVHGFDAPSVAGVGGPVRAAEPGITSEYADLRGLLDPKRSVEGSIEYVITANACFRRDVLLEAGLFSESFEKPGGEEVELCYRLRALGYELRAVDDAVVLHHHRSTMRALLGTLANYGEGHHVLGQLWPELRLRRPFLGFARAIVALHGAARHVTRHRKDQPWKKAFAFGFLDYLYLPAFLFGYMRARRLRHSATGARPDARAAAGGQGQTRSLGAPVPPPRKRTQDHGRHRQD